MSRAAAALLAALAAIAALPAGATAATAALRLVDLGRADTPVGITAAPGQTDRVYVAEKAGRIVTLRGGVRTVVADLTDRVKADGAEQGLLGLAFAPDYATTGKLYVYYTAPAPQTADNGSDLVVAELRRGASGRIDPSTERVLLRIPHRLEEYENGGGLRFGPDGMLWIGTGDGGGEFDAHANAQRLDPATDDAALGRDALLGKLLRIDPRPGDGCGGACTIPDGNPGFAQREVWSSGLRNPWRFSFDDATGDLVLGDVGNHAYEEVDFAPAPDRGRGADYGWPFFEGAHPVPDAASPPAGCCTAPVIERSHADPDDFDAVVGGIVVRDPALPALAGRYLYAALGAGRIHAVTLGPGGASDDHETGLTLPALTSFGEDACSHVLVTAYDGRVEQIAQEAAGGCVTPVAVTARAASVQRGWRSGSLRLSVTCSAACAMTASGAFSGGGRLVTATARARLRAGTRTVVVLGVGPAVRRALAVRLARGRTVTVRFTVTAAAAGGTGRAVATSRLHGRRRAGYS